MMVKGEIQDLMTFELIIIKKGMIRHTQQTEEEINNPITLIVGNTTQKHQLRTMHLELPQ